MSDALTLARDIAGDGAQTAATRLNPSEDKLSQIDAPADDNTWHDVPDVANIRNQVKDQYNTRKPFGNKDQAKDAAAGDASDVKAAKDQGGAGNAAGTLKGKAQVNMSEESQEKARKARERTRSYLESKMPKERREQTIWRLKKMIVEIQGHQDCKSALFHSSHVLFHSQANSTAPL